MIIYKITNRINGKIYIGQTIKTVEHRWMLHCSEHSGCLALSSAIKKYGKESFVVEVIDKASSMAELNEKEIFWIKNCGAMYPAGYNLREGGENGGKLSENTKSKISRANKGRVHTAQARKNMSEAGKGRKCWWSGKKMPREAVEKAIKSRSGYKHSEETKLKMSQSHKGKTVPDSMRKHLSEMNKGKPTHLSKGVMCVETGDTFICASEAEREYKTGHIIEVCRGKRKTAGGYHWQYLQEAFND